MRGSESFPGPLLDIVAETVESGDLQLTIIRPRDWAELRHQDGADGLSAPYWAIAWPSGRALAEVVAARDLSGTHVLELGCGLALPSLAAAKRGAEVLATDSSPDAVVFAAHNFALNEVEGEVAQADWREADPLVESGPWDLVLAADVLYLRHNVEALLRVLPALLGGEGEALIADPNRAGGRDFAAAARRMFELESRPDPGREKMTLHRLTRR
ncbi:MAG TPA: methyltransferase domain-containing protein [Thermoleophilaceae bacterium]